MWRILPDAEVDQRMLVIESAGGHIEPPRRYVNQYGQFLESAPYAERDIRPPDALATHDEEGEFEVRVKARGFIARYIYTIIIRSMSSAGTDTCGRSRSTSKTSSRLPDACTSRRRFIRRSTGRAS